MNHVCIYLKHVHRSTINALNCAIKIGNHNINFYQSLSLCSLKLLNAFATTAVLAIHHIIIVHGLIKFTIFLLVAYIFSNHMNISYTYIINNDYNVGSYNNKKKIPK